MLFRSRNLPEFDRTRSRFILIASRRVEAPQIFVMAVDLSSEHLYPGIFQQSKCRNIIRARSKHTLSTVETYLEHSQNIPSARSNYTSSTFETYLEHSRDKYLEHGRIIPRAQSKHTLSRVEIQTSSTVELYLEHGRNTP